MNPLFASVIGGWEMVLILAVILILFGAKKLPELAKGLGQGIKEFKKATRDVSDEMQRALEEDNTPPPPRKITSGQVVATSSQPESVSTTPQSSTAPKA